ncbi:MAG: FHA domain-containing protein [Clostridia bacterium]|nr:FHA domain-containing protein [Clostridia bacterium]
MKPIKCENCKMFYDGDKYESCPHCKASSTSENEAKAAEKEDSVNSIRKTSRKMTEKKPTERPVTEKHAEDMSQRGKSLKGLFFHKKEKIQEEVVSVEEVPTAPVMPEPAEETATERKEVSRTVPQPQTEPVPTPVKEEYYGEKTEEIRRPAPPVVEEPEEEDEPTVIPSIADAVQRADSTSNSADEKTVAFYNFSNAIEPVVGWIICVEGEYMGESFSLKSGRNNIGRSLAMDIALAKEKSVSRERHASITYEPNKMKFYIQSGESSGLTYVNDELIMMFTELNDYDVITLGASKFVFLRLCGEKFSWDNYS